METLLDQHPSIVLGGGRLYPSSPNGGTLLLPRLALPLLRRKMASICHKQRQIQIGLCCFIINIMDILIHLYPSGQQFHCFKEILCCLGGLIPHICSCYHL